MASLRDIRRKIKSVKNTQQITKAMKTCPPDVLRAGPPVARGVVAAKLYMVCMFIFASSTLCEADKWSDAEKEIKTRSPQEYSALPRSVVSKLIEMKCIIPQDYYPQPSNVIKGEFAKRGQTDYAALCSKSQGKTSIRVIWGGAAKCKAELNEDRDRSYLMEIGNNRIGYARRLDVIPSQYIKEHLSLSGTEAHEAIKDAFDGKGSKVKYCDNGKWVDVSGRSE